MFRVMCLCASCLGTLSAVAQTQVVTLQTSKSVGEEVTLVVNPGADVTVDWGDANPVKTRQDTLVGVLKGTTVTVSGGPLWNTLGCEGNRIVSMNLTRATFLKALFCAHNELTALSLPTSGALTDLDCSYNRLTSFVPRASGLLTLDCSHNELTQFALTFAPAVRVLDCSYNKLASLAFTNANAALEYLACNDNRLTRISLPAGMTNLNSLYCFRNELETLSVGTRDSLENLWCDANRITALDLSKCPDLKTLSVSKNRLNSIAYPSVATKSDYTLVSIQENNLGYNYFLPRQSVEDYNTCFTYTYAPQNRLAVADAVDVGEQLDFSAQYKNAAGKVNGPSFRLYLADGTELVQGTDYARSAGKITFLKGFADSVYVGITAGSAYYPGLTIETSRIKVTDPMGIGTVKNSSGLLMDTTEGVLTLSAGWVVDVKIHNIEGMQVWEGRVSVTPVRVALPKGLYIVNGKKISL